MSLTVLLISLPGGSGQGYKQGLQDSPDVNDGALFGDEEVHGRQDEQTVQHQTKHHGDGIKTQLLPHCRGITHLQDFTSHQENNAEWKVPGRTKCTPLKSANSFMSANIRTTNR